MTYLSWNLRRGLRVRVALAGAVLLGGSQSLLTAAEEPAKATDASESPQPPPPAKPPERPKYNPVARDKEDWSKFTAGEGGDLFDPIKHINLSEDGDVWTSFGGQVRLRLESWRNFGASKSELADDDFLLSRFRFHNDTHVGENLRFFTEGISALSTNPNFRNMGALDVNTFDLQQAFFDLKVPLAQETAFTLRGGRQELLFGKQRLVSPLDWSNTRRTWDGFKGTLNIPGGWSVNGFWTQFVSPNQKYDFNDADAQAPFWGVYATGPIGLVPDMNADVYYLGLDRQDSLAGKTGDERHTAGGRLFGKVGKTGFDYDFEGAYQWGARPGDVDVSAFMIGSEFGYNLADFPGAPRVFAGFDYGSGDSDPTDGKFQTFSQLFPLGHAYLGFIDIVGRQNIEAYTVGTSFTPAQKFTMLVQGHAFRLADDASPLFNAGGGAVGGQAGTKDVGYELDLLLTHQYDAHTQVTVGYSHLFAGDYFDVAGKGEDIDFFYLGWQYTF